MGATFFKEAASSFPFRHNFHYNFTEVSQQLQAALCANVIELSFIVPLIKLPE